MRVSLFAITPGHGRADEIRARVPALARGGVEHLLLREKDLPEDARRRLARELAALAVERGLRLWISDDRTLAREVGAGVHLSEGGGPAPADLPYGLSLHEGSPRSAEERAGAHHAFFGPVFETPSKQGILEPIGCAAFLSRERAETCPLYALGGVVPGTLEELARAGVRRVAAIRLFFGAPDPEATARRAREILSEAPSCP